MFLQSATSRYGSRRVDRAIALLDARNLAIHIDHKRRAVGQERFLAQHAILLHHLSFVIGQHRKFRAYFFLPMSQRRDEISADC